MAERYLDDILGRNEKDQNYREDHPHYRTQAQRSRPRPGYYRSDAERDYSVRMNPAPQDDYYNFRDGEFYSERKHGFYGKGPKGRTFSDERIKEEVSEELFRSYEVDASEIEVAVKEGVVTLTGTVEGREAKRAAEACIENLTGVVDIHNRLTVADKKAAH